MKKEKLINNLIWYFLLIVRVAFFIQLLYKTCIIYQGEIVKVVIFAIIGLIFSFVVTTIIHELGHLIFGLIVNLKLVSFRVLWLKFTFGENVKVSFELMRGNFGETNFVPKNKENVAKKIGFTALGGLLFNFIYLMFSFVMAIDFIDNNLLIFCLFGLSFAVPMYVLSSASVPFTHNSDGWVFIAMTFGKKTPIIVKNYAIAYSQIESGIPPFEIDPKLLTTYTLDYDSYSVGIIFLRYLSFISFDNNKAFQEIYKISDRDKLPGTMYNTILSEMLFCSLLLKDQKFVDKNIDEVLDYLSMEDTPSSYRIQAAIYITKGERERARLIINSGINIINEKNGFDLLEKTLLEKLQELV